MTLARALVETGGAAVRTEVDAELSATEDFIDRSGATTWLPHVHVERARLARALGDEQTHERELREALRLFTAMRATGHAERVAKDLGL